MVVAPTQPTVQPEVQALILKLEGFVSEPAVKLIATLPLLATGTLTAVGLPGTVVSIVTVAAEATNAEVLPARSTDCRQA